MSARLPGERGAVPVVETRVSTGLTYTTGDAATARHGGWSPRRVLGAASEFSLALPDATPTRGHLYAPRGVLLDPGAGAATRVIAADTGNHRLLVWPELPDVDGADCAVVIGQPGPTGEGPQAGGRGPERGLHLPTGLARVGDLLLVADGWNHRVLAFDAAFDRDDPAPLFVIGQPDLASVAENAGGPVTGSSFYWPFGLLWHAGWLWVADTGNRRVLGWQGVPGRDGPADRPADLVLGQPDPHSREENRGGVVAADSFRWPHAVTVTGSTGSVGSGGSAEPTDSAGEVLWVADAGNHRLLGWRLPLTADRPADLVLGQPGPSSAQEMPHVPQGPARLRFPYAAATAGNTLLVADTANNRVLGWSVPPRPGAAAGAAADLVLGQDGFDPAGENRWTAVTPDGMCWPYGLSALIGAGGGPDLLAVADSGNNRIVVWQR